MCFHIPPHPTPSFTAVLHPCFPFLLGSLYDSTPHICCIHATHIIPAFCSLLFGFHFRVISCVSCILSNERVVYLWIHRRYLPIMVIRTPHLRPIAISLFTYTPPRGWPRHICNRTFPQFAAYLEMAIICIFRCRPGRLEPAAYMLREGTGCRCLLVAIVAAGRIFTRTSLQRANLELIRKRREPPWSEQMRYKLGFCL